jgi:hypothetical protein
MVNLDISGGPVVFNDFTPSAFKYDSSSFYNFEQDNLSIWDLEDRTNFNYYKLGASLSSLSGLTFTLSSTSNVSANVYSDIQDIVDRLPKVIKDPIVVEIAKYGDLGELNLQGISFEGDGALLVKNLIYATMSGTTGNPRVSSSLGTYPDGNPRTHVTQISAIEWTNTLTNAQTSNPNFSGVSVHSDSDLSGNYRTLLEKRKSGTYLNLGVPEMVHVDIESSNFSRTSNVYTLSAYTTERDISVSSSDIDIYWQNGFDTSRSLELDTTWFRPTNQTVDTYNGVIFGNYFTKVKIKNCDGNAESVILSGICVDSGTEYVDLSSLEHTTDHGFDITQSHANLIDCVAMRCKKSGFKLENSDVSVSGYMSAYRIYDPQWDSNVSSLLHNGTGTGVHLINSRLHFPTEGEYPGAEVYAFSRCDQGMWLQNSVIDGGNQTTSATNMAQTGANSIITITCYHNLKDGVKAENSSIRLFGLWMVYSNGHNGFNLENSYAGFTQYLVTHNFDTGIKANKSRVEYAINGAFPAYGANVEFISNILYGGATLGKIASYHCTHNNLNIHLKGSIMTPWIDPNSTSTAESIGAMNDMASWSYGATTSGVGCNKPYMILDNSYGEFVHFLGSTMAGNGYNPGSIKGAICLARDGSTAKFIGTKKSTTLALGTANAAIGVGTEGFHGNANNLPYFQRMAAFAAINHSTIEFNGPTKIVHFGIGALAENNSVIRFGPQKQDGTLLTKTWQLEDEGNHTKVDLHSTRAGIVVKDHSKLEMEYMGDGDFTPHGSTDDNFTDGLPYVTAAHVSGGYFQFYPNPYDESMGADDRFSLSSNLGSVNYRISNLTMEQSAGSYGGMCVRALGQSEVNVKNVNFPMGMEPTLLSGAYYDLSTTCWWPFIWNFADDSRIIARNIKVSGVDDGSHGYHGPSGIWAIDGVELDWYGASGPRQIANGDNSNYQNYGPFRLYFSV